MATILRIWQVVLDSGDERWLPLAHLARRGLLRVPSGSPLVEVAGDNKSTGKSSSADAPIVGAPAEASIDGGINGSSSNHDASGDTNSGDGNEGNGGCAELDIDHILSIAADDHGDGDGERRAPPPAHSSDSAKSQMTGKAGEVAISAGEIASSSGEVASSAPAQSDGHADAAAPCAVDAKAESARQKSAPKPPKPLKLKAPKPIASEPKQPKPSGRPRGRPPKSASSKEGEAKGEAARKKRPAETPKAGPGEAAPAKRPRGRPPASANASGMKVVGKEARVRDVVEKSPPSQRTRSREGSSQKLVCLPP